MMGCSSAWRLFFREKTYLEKWSRQKSWQKVQSVALSIVHQQNETLEFDLLFSLTTDLCLAWKNSRINNWSTLDQRRYFLRRTQRRRAFFFRVILRRETFRSMISVLNTHPSLSFLSSVFVSNLKREEIEENRLMTKRLVKSHSDDKNSLERHIAVSFVRWRIDEGEDEVLIFRGLRASWARQSCLHIVTSELLLIVVLEDLPEP